MLRFPRTYGYTPTDAMFANALLRAGRIGLTRTRVAATAAAAAAAGTATIAFCEPLSFDACMVLVESAPGSWTWQPRPSAAPLELPPPGATAPAVAAREPMVTNPVTVVDTPGISIREFFGQVSSHDGTASFALADVHRADEAGFQVRRRAQERSGTGCTHAAPPSALARCHPTPSLTPLMLGRRHDSQNMLS